jgi:hypothetical protein
MCRASEFYPGAAKTDRRDSFVLADTARTHARQVHRLEAADETLERLRLLGGYDDDLAHDVNRTANRLRDMLLAIGPALERVLGLGSTIPPPGHRSPAIRRRRRCEPPAGAGWDRWRSATRRGWARGS